MLKTGKPLVWMADVLKTPPIGREARRQAGTLLRLLQEGEKLALPHSRPMPGLGKRVHELRVRDGESGLTWRILYRVDEDAILVVEWFAKKAEKTSKAVIDTCKRRLKRYDEAARMGGGR